MNRNRFGLPALIACIVFLTALPVASGQKTSGSSVAGDPGGQRANPNLVAVAYKSALWPKVNGVATVYYQVDAASDPNATTKINAAISTFNADFAGVIQWTLWNSPNTQGPYYVDISLNPNDFSGQCEALEGYEAVAGQLMTGSTACTAGTLLHEMGHVIGLWHEQSRIDRSSYITVNYSNVIKGSWGNFLITPDNHENLSLFDYASLMEYPAFSFSRNGGPVIESIPAGIPLGSAEGMPIGTADYSAADKEGILRLYGVAPTVVTVTSNPVGLQVVVDGAVVTTPHSYPWALNSTHTLSVATGVQSLSGNINNSSVATTFYYTYGRWNDNATQTHTITVKPGNGQVGFPVTSPKYSTFSANFIQLVPYTSTVYPSGTGSVAVSPLPKTYTGNPGEYFIARQRVELIATANPGWNFYEFNNGPFWLPGGLGLNPKYFYAPDTGNPVNATAEFSNSAVYTVTASPVTFSSDLYAYVDGGFAYLPKNFSADYDSAWTPKSSHTLSLFSPEYPYSSNSKYVFSKWSDHGALTHTISSLPATSTTFTVTMTAQYLAGTNFSYPPCGGSATLTPASPSLDGFYSKGQILTYRATPAAGWSFAGWSNDITGTTNPATLTANDESLVYANFNTTTTPLRLTSLTPSSAAAGGKGFVLTLTGTGFTPGSLVSVNGSYRTPTFASATSLSVPITTADIARVTNLSVFVENFPSGWNGCAVFGSLPFTVY